MSSNIYKGQFFNFLVTRRYPGKGYYKFWTETPYYGGSYVTAALTMGACASRDSLGRKLSPYENLLAKGALRGTPSIINAALYFNELPSAAGLAALQAELFKFDCFSAVPKAGRWVPQVPDAAKHLLHAEVASEPALHAYLEKASMQLLRHSSDDAESTPRWELHAVRNCGAGRSMLLCRIDHALGDGIALSQVWPHLSTFTILAGALRSHALNLPMRRLC